MGVKYKVVTKNAVDLLNKLKAFNEDLVELLDIINTEKLIEEMKRINEGSFSVGEILQMNSKLTEKLNHFQSEMESVIFELVDYKRKNLTLIQPKLLKYLNDVSEHKIKFDKEMISQYGGNGELLSNLFNNLCLIDEDYAKLFLYSL